MQMSALDTDCTSGTGKIHAFTLNFTEIESGQPCVYTYDSGVMCAPLSFDIYDFASHLSRTVCMNYLGRFISFLIRVCRLLPLLLKRYSPYRIN